MAKRFTNSEKWNNPWFMALPIEAKLFWMYLLDACDHAGIWKVNMLLAHFLTGTNLDQEKVLEIFKGKIEDVGKGYWYIPKFIDYQYGELNPKNPAHNSALKILDKFGKAPCKPLDRPLKGSKDKDKDKDKDTDKVSEEAELGYQEYPTTRIIDGEKTSTGKQLSHKQGIQRAIKDGYPFREVVRLKKAAGDAFPNLKTFLNNLPDPVELRKFGKDKPAYQECHPLKHDWAEPVNASDGTQRKKCRQCPRVETIYG